MKRLICEFNEIRFVHDVCAILIMKRRFNYCYSIRFSTNRKLLVCGSVFRLFDATSYYECVICFCCCYWLQYCHFHAKRLFDYINCQCFVYLCCICPNDSFLVSISFGLIFAMCNTLQLHKAQPKIHRCVCVSISLCAFETFSPVENDE